MKVKDSDVIKLFKKFKVADWKYFINSWGLLRVTDFVKSDDDLSKLKKTEFTQKAVILFKVKFR